MKFLKYVFCVYIISILSACKNLENKTATLQQGVNVLIIIADDAGWNDVGYNGSEINTPNIDWLANNGVQLNRFYANPTCSPSRVSLLTGMPASRIGIVAPISGKSKKTLPDSITTLPQALKKHNYENALIGKWHLGLDIANGPNAFGFDYSYGFLHGQIDQYTHVYKNGDKSWYRNDAFIEEEGHATDLITNEAINWLTKKRDTTKNFYLQLAYSAPHYPLQEEEKWKAPYLKSIENDSRRDYAAAMSHLDEAIGNVMEALKQSKLDENTLVIFLSDNGAQKEWYPTKEYDLKHGPNPVLGSNKPLRDFKKSNYEGAIRVPAIMYWKNQLTSQINTNYISVTDIMPTILSLAGSEISKDVEGVNIWPSVLDGNVATNHDIYVRGHIQESIIHQPWKLVRQRNNKNQPTIYQLFNIDSDPEEKNNVRDKHPAVLAEMKLLIEAQFAKDDKQVNAGFNQGEY
ncbi:arylsulfatase [Mariniflexile litorale]|uniref:Arylsulfatase n=1 Tax=Mariniflexile litorale TaxID=3045158 RepID=A0AAU7EKV1_9FLAO|nr:arylsulfatase [Mariniflexile sp. KMM 9835]MDQ8210650.1 arylsulfatase [Mariniflexile sp. KMM 9835]